MGVSVVSSGVDIRAMRSFGQTKGEDRSFFEQLGSLFLGLFIRAHPDGAQAQDADLEAVPVTQPVKGQQFTVFAVAGRVPAAVRITAGILARGEQLGEDLFFADKIDEFAVPDLLIEILRESGLTHLFEEGNGFVHNSL
ncbi:MAG: hypothetical protein MZV70_66235 [Desulfobacterales bacterium]|nr:hypothetical protein [Desulfobacterales bacterium]